MMPTFIERLSAGNVLVSDGATGTNLQQAGLKPGEHPEEWVYSHPDRITDLERAFVEAGSDIILTCTFGATRTRLAGQRARPISSGGIEGEARGSSGSWMA